MSNRRVSDLLVPGSFLFFVFAAAVFRLSSYDIWWHLATGRLIFSGHGIPRSDPFSFTAPGVEWIDHEWLFQCLAYAAHGLGGAPALVLSKALLLTMVAGLVWLFVRRHSELSAPACAFVLISFVLAGRDRFLVRPEIFSILFAALLVTTLLHRRPRELGWRQLWWVPLLFALWANLHAGVIVGLMLLLTFVAGRMLQRLPKVGSENPPSYSELGTLIAVTLCAVLGGLANPFLHKVYEAPFRLTAIIESGVYDNFEWRHPGWPSQWLFYLVVVTGVVVALWGIRRREWPAALMLLLLAALGLKYVRNIGLYSLLAPIMLARILAPSAAPRDDSTPRARLLAGLPAPVVAGLLAALGLWLLIAGYHFPAGIGIDKNRVPVGGADFIERIKPPGNLFNVYGFGGYAAWRLWPEVTIFIDGRNEVFLELRQELRESVADSRRWLQLLDHYQIGFTLLSHGRELEQVTLMDPDGGPPRTAWWPYTVTHFPRHDWALLYFDDTSMVFVRRSPESTALISDYEYAHVFPHSPDFQVEAIRLGWATVDGCLRELDHKLREDPECQRAASLSHTVVEAFAVQSR